MPINVAQLLKEPIGSRRSYTIEQIIDSSEAVEGSIQGEVKLLRTDRGILVNATVQTQISTICSRCLAPFDCPLTAKIEEIYYPSVDIATGLPLARPMESDAFSIDHNHILDLSEAVRQYTLLAMPMKPLCRLDCAGLCPQCGANWNERGCDCRPPSDSRWAALKELTAGARLSIRQRGAN